MMVAWIKVLALEVVKVVLCSMSWVCARTYVPTHPSIHSLTHPPTHPSSSHRTLGFSLAQVIIQQTQAIWSPHVMGGSLSDSIQNKTETAPLLIFTSLNTD